MESINDQEITNWAMHKYYKIYKGNIRSNQTNWYKLFWEWLQVWNIRSAIFIV